MSITLARETRLKGQSFMVKLQLFNGVAASLVMGDLLALLALYYGATSSQTAWLYGAIHIAGLSTFVAPALLKGKNVRNIWLFFWWARTLVILGFFVLPFLSPPVYQVWALIGLYYVFMVFRAIGGATFLPIMKELSTDRERGSFMARVFRSFSIANILVALLSYGFMEIGVFDSTLANLNFLIFIGFVLGCVTSVMIARVPSNEVLTHSSLGSMFQVFWVILKDQEYRRVAVLVVMQTAILICTAYQVNFFDKALQWEPSKILFVSLVGLVGAMIASQLFQIISGRISSWIILLGAHAVLGAGCLFFALANVFELQAGVWVFIVPALFVFVGRSGSSIVLNQLQAERLPEGQSYQYSVAYQLFAVISAVCVIGFIRGYEGLFGVMVTETSANLAPIFGVGFIVCLVVCGFSFLVQRPNEFLENLLLAAPSNFMTHYRMYRLDRQVPEQHVSHVMEGALRRGNPSSRVYMMEYLQSSDLRKRYAAFRAAVNSPDHAYFESTLNEALSKDSPLRSEAITALGFVARPDDLPAVLPLLDDADIAVQAMAYKTLLRLNASLDDERVLGFYKNLSSQVHKMNVLIGVVESHREALLDCILSYELALKPDDYWTRSLFNYSASIRGARDTMSDILDSEYGESGKGLSVLFEYLEDPVLGVFDRDRLKPYFEEQKFDDLAKSLHAHGAPDWMVPCDRFSALGLLYLLGTEQNS